MSLPDDGRDYVFLCHTLWSFILLFSAHVVRPRGFPLGGRSPGSFRGKRSECLPEVDDGNAQTGTCTNEMRRHHWTCQASEEDVQES